jgi:hypothetical protein
LVAATLKESNMAAMIAFWLSCALLFIVLFEPLPHAKRKGKQATTN